MFQINIDIIIRVNRVQKAKQLRATRLEARAETDPIAPGGDKVGGRGAEGGRGRSRKISMAGNGRREGPEHVRR